MNNHDLITLIAAVKDAPMWPNISAGGHKFKEKLYEFNSPLSTNSTLSALL